MVHQYRKKTSQMISVEAVQLTAENAVEVAAWCEGLDVLEHDAVDSSKTYAGVNVPTQEGRRRASEGDYIVKLNGRFFIRQARAFENKYVQV